MSGNSFGTLFKITTFGESHGAAIGVVIDGCPAGISIQKQDIQYELDRRKPGQSIITTQRKEHDEIEILSGLFNGKTLGTPISLLVYNKDAKSKDYENVKSTYRPSHADFTYEKKFGLRDFRGGGRASARETVARVAAGAIAKKILTNSLSIETIAYVSSIKDIRTHVSYKKLDLSNIEKTAVRCPDIEVANKMIALIQETKEKGDSIGGTITCVVKNCPIGLGEPVFDKLDAKLAQAILSIPAVKGFEIGSGFEGTTQYGSEHNDAFINEKDTIKTLSNKSGGVQGGISNGMDIVFKVAFKPTATIAQAQKTVDSKGNQVSLNVQGRHDPCVLPRAVPIVEAMTNLVLADLYLLSKTNKI